MSAESANKWIICRICLKNNGHELTPIEGKQTKLDKLKQKIEELGGIRLQEDAKLPNKICEKCLLLLRAADKFRTLCKRSQRQLSELLQLSEPKSVEAVLDDGNENREHEAIDDSIEVYTQTTTKKTSFEFKEHPQEDYLEEQEEELRLLEIEHSGIIETVDGEYISIPRARFDYTEGDEETTNQDDPYNLSYCSEIYEVLESNENSQSSSVKVESVSYEVQMEMDPADGEEGGDETAVTVYKVERSSDSPIPEESFTIPKPAPKRKRNTRPKKTQSTSTGTEQEASGAKSRKLSSYVCSYCGNTYNERAKLTLHMKIHTKEKPHECEICHKRFTHTPQLARHMNSHTGLRPYKCRFCPSSFADPSTCVKHERIHTNERPYSCEYCGKAFSYSNVLKVHIMMHRGEKPFQCSVCGKNFAQLHHKRHHERIHDNEVMKLNEESIDEMQ